MTNVPDSLVYVVDDEPAVLDSLSSLLRAHRFSVRSFASAEAFLSAFDPAAHACLLLDLRMPGMSGTELQAVLNERGHDVPIVILTAHGDIPLAVKAMKAGAEDFIEKPGSEEHLLRAIRSALQRPAERTPGTPLTAEVAARLQRLTGRERQVLDHVVVGLTNKTIAEKFGISQRTVEIHRARIREKLEARGLADLIRMMR